MSFLELFNKACIILEKIDGFGYTHGHWLHEAVVLKYFSPDSIYNEPPPQYQDLFNKHLGRYIYELVTYSTKLCSKLFRDVYTKKCQIQELLEFCFKFGLDATNLNTACLQNNSDNDTLKYPFLRACLRCPQIANVLLDMDLVNVNTTVCNTSAFSLASRSFCNNKELVGRLALLSNNECITNEALKLWISFLTDFNSYQQVYDCLVTMLENRYKRKCDCDDDRGLAYLFAYDDQILNQNQNLLKAYNWYCHIAQSDLVRVDNLFQATYIHKAFEIIDLRKQEFLQYKTNMSCFVGNFCNSVLCVDFSLLIKSYL
jgi:hypothetical protein